MLEFTADLGEVLGRPGSIDQAAAAAIAILEAWADGPSFICFTVATIGAAGE
jgi:hypothetical protein